MNLADNSVFKRHVRRTPLLSLAEKENLFCKLECCQVGGSFKIRGSLATLLELETEGDKRGVVTASMGNTATGLAYAGRLFKYPVAVVMPETVSATKLAATRQIGAEVILKGKVGDDALEHSFKLAKDRDILFVHPHKTPSFLDGNATIAREIMEENSEIKQIFIPIGGGGLASGICKYIQESGIAVTPIGVEAEKAPAFYQSFEKGRPVKLETMDTIADALTLMEPDPDVFAYLYQNLKKVVPVAEKDIIRTMKVLYDEFRVITEPGGAAPLAAMLGENPAVPSVAIISGGNISLGEFQKIISGA